MRKFDLQAERNYYHANPQGVCKTDDAVVENMMRCCTNLKNLYSLIDDKIVLEVGVGECSYLHAFLKKAIPRLYIAQDIFPERMLHAKHFFVNSNVCFIGSDVLKIPLKDNSIDFCMAFGLLHHIPNLSEAIAEITRVLKPGGHFPFRDTWAGNPAIWLKYRFGHRSENEFPLTKRNILQVFRTVGLKELHIARFWLRFPWLPSGPWSVNIGGIAIKDSA